MKQLLAMFSLWMGFISPVSCGAETAQGRLYCLSAQFQQGSDQFGLYTLDISSYDPQSFINGELFPYFGTYTHEGNFAVNDPSGFSFGGTMQLNLPLSTDANNDGFADFFEVPQSISATTSGVFSVPGSGSGTLQATWSRAAGSAGGTCVLNFSDPLSDIYTCAFQVLQYAGPVSYTPGSNVVNGSVSLTNAADATQRFFGPIAFLKSATNQFNQLELQPGAWTNANAQTLTFTNNLFQRDSTRLTNYFGSILFDDGDPSSAEPDYRLWAFFIDDPNDSNHNGIPDFSDTPGATLRQPTLTLSQGSTNFLLSISGDVGTVCQVQETASMSPANWQTNQSMTLTNDPQIVPLPLAAAGSKFLRVLAQ